MQSTEHLGSRAASGHTWNRNKRTAASFWFSLHHSECKKAIKLDMEKVIFSKTANDLLQMSIVHSFQSSTVCICSSLKWGFKGQICCSINQSYRGLCRERNHLATVACCLLSRQGTLRRDPVLASCCSKILDSVNRSSSSYFSYQNTWENPRKSATHVKSLTQFLQPINSNYL